MVKNDSHVIQLPEPTFTKMITEPNWESQIQGYDSFHRFNLQHGIFYKEELKSFPPVKHAQKKGQFYWPLRILRRQP